MGRHAKHKYICRNCKTEYYENITPELCPNCGSVGTVHHGSLRSLETSEDYIHQLSLIIPEMDRLMRDFSALYADYCKIREVLRQYANRGIIDRCEIPVYYLPNFSDVFYNSRTKHMK